MHARIRARPRVHSWHARAYTPGTPAAPHVVSRDDPQNKRDEATAVTVPLVVRITPKCHSYSDGRSTQGAVAVALLALAHAARLGGSEHSRKILTSSPSPLPRPSYHLTLLATVCLRPHAGRCSSGLSSAPSLLASDSWRAIESEPVRRRHAHKRRTRALLAPTHAARSRHLLGSELDPFRSNAP